MTENTETVGKLPPNTILFCKRPWKIPAAVLSFLVFLTFTWGLYVLDTYRDDDYFSDLDDLSVTEFLFRDVAQPNDQRLYETVPPAVVGIGDSRVNSGIVASGAIVGSSGYVLTSLNAVSALQEIRVLVKTPSGIERYQAEVVKSLPSHDLTLLKMLTNDRFLFFAMAATEGLQQGERVFGFGQGSGGNTIVAQGSLLSTNDAITADRSTVSHLMANNAVYTWEQNGGPLVNAAGELVGINLALRGPSGTVEGYAVPAHVITAHFGDVLDFKIAGTRPAARQAAPAPAAAVPVPAAGTAFSPDAGATAPGMTGSAAWWANARAQVAGDRPALGMNTAMGVAGEPAPPPSIHSVGPSVGGYPLTDVLALALLALAAGVVGGMMTMGGGVLQVAGMMVFFGYGMYLIRPVAYLTNIVVYGAATIRNRQSGLVMWNVVRKLAPWAVGGVVAGYFLGNAMGDDAVAILLGVFALLAALKGLQEIFVDDSDGILVKTAGAETVAPVDDAADGFFEFDDEIAPPPAAPAPALAESAGLGLPIGLVSGILGISGGVVGVPLQRFFGGISLHNAIANSSVLVLAASTGGALVAFVHGVGSGLIEWQVPVTLALIMAPGAYLGGLLGARLMNILPVAALKWFYTTVMLAISVKMLFLS